MPRKGGLTRTRLEKQRGVRSCRTLTAMLRILDFKPQNVPGPEWTSTGHTVSIAQAALERLGRGGWGARTAASTLICSLSRRERNCLLLADRKKLKMSRDV